MTDTRKFSGITMAGSPPASDDSFVGVTAGGADTRWTLGQINSITLTADTDITAGTAVSINSSGHAVQTWGPAPNVAGVVTILPYTTLYGAGGDFPDALAIVVQDPTHFIGWDTHLDTSISALVACSVSDTTVAAGTPVTISSAGSAVVSLSDSLLVALDAAGNATAGSISGLEITLGSPQGLGIGAINFGAALNSTTFVAGPASSNFPGQAVAATVSGTTITPGTPVTIGDGACGFGVIAALDTSLFVIAYSDVNNSEILTLVAGTVSGTTIELGTPVAIDGTVIENADEIAIQIAKLSDSSFVVFFQSTGGQSKNAQALVGTVSGTTITAGAPVIIAPYYTGESLTPYAAAAATSQIAVISPTKVAFAAGPTLPQVCTISGTTLTVPAIVNVPTDTLGNPGVSSNYQSTTQNTIINAVVAAGSNLVVTDGSSNVYEVDQASSKVSAAIVHATLNNYGLSPLTDTTVLAWFGDFSGNFQARVIVVEPINNGPVGFTAEGVSEGGTVTVTTSGIALGFTGLTPGAVYYHNGDGAITLGNTGHKAGVALTSSTLLIQ